MVVVVVVVSGSQVSSVTLRLTILSLVALVKVRVLLEESPPALGVQYFTVSQSSVMVLLPL